jgi:hypothetical protein
MMKGSWRHLSGVRGYDNRLRYSEDMPLYTEYGSLRSLAGVRCISCGRGQWMENISGSLVGQGVH